MGELALPIALGLLAVSLTGISAGLALAWTSARARAAQSEALLSESTQQVDELSAALTDHKHDVARLTQELKQADKEHGEATVGFDGEREQWNATRTGLEQERALARRERDEQIQAMTGLQQELDTSRREASQHARSVRAHSRMLEALGLKLRAPRNPVAANERMHTRAVLRQLVVSSGSEAAGLVASTGLVAFGAGKDASLERLGVTGALAAAVEPELSAMLCAPVAGFSVVGPRFAQHLLRVHGSNHYVAAENQGDAPMFALQHARLAIAGLPTAPTPTPKMPDTFLDLDDPADERLGPILAEWAKRWKAQTVTVIGPDGRPLAVTSGADPGAAMGLTKGLRTMTVRAVRDRVPLDTLSIAAWSEDGLTAQVVFVHADLDTAAIVSLAPTPLPDRALTELQSTVRWHLSASVQPTREAS